MKQVRNGPAIPVGVDHPIGEKIAAARRLLAVHGAALHSDPAVAGLLGRYRAALRDSRREMEAGGIVAECTECAVVDGGSCCGRGIENRFDAVLLLVNLLLGAELPDRPEDPDGCWFLGAAGCRIPARHVICINYVCPRLVRRLGPEGLRSYQARVAREADLGFALEEALKRWLRNRT
ncbi:hypothetical protein G3N55_03775 [Dissulfurirhabdus thermomarina]|uniref:Uncharacterized protein n=1 Tax=Dissulfurirhabdus thermomarina TaxID=1765737 RepID=A0A6N9TLP9_DISTH|nr:hypothetical protein [Dissulfurirhabdus thermomarina]NDY41968.1 hypothetical protein [Dissulfurirhabdus thermomarina]NMX22809.1 hypothetical protein [Dissulfurirhabdus thermomarina]